MKITPVTGTIEIRVDLKVIKLFSCKKTRTCRNLKKKKSMDKFNSRFITVKEKSQWVEDNQKIIMKRTAQWDRKMENSKKILNTHQRKDFLDSPLT